MIFREATINDISQIQVVRNSVKENMLSDPNLVTDKDCEEFLTERGKGWVCEIGNQIAGFSIVDLKENNVWALFLKPEFEGRGIGRKLHNLMLDWYFQHTKNPIWLGTEFNTRAEKFYELQGWEKVGLHGTRETKFEMTYEKWKALNK